MKHIFFKIDVRSCEHEFTLPIVSSIEDDMNTDDFVQECLKEFYGDEDYTVEEDESVTYQNGLVGSLNCVNEITEAEYEVLKRFI